MLYFDTLTKNEHWVDFIKVNLAYWGENLRFVKKETTEPQVNQDGKSILFHNVPCFFLSADMGLNFSRLINTIVPSRLVLNFW